MDGSVVAAWETMLTEVSDPLAVAQAAEVVIGFCHARQLQGLNGVFEEALLGADPDGVVVDPTSAEVACADRLDRDRRGRPLPDLDQPTGQEIHQPPQRPLAVSPCRVRR